MIKNRQFLSVAEVKEFLDKKKEKDNELKGFIEKFSELSVDDAKKLRKELEATEIMKLQDETIVKIIDFMPENENELNKILNGTGLDENETKKVLDTVKKYK